MDEAHRTITLAWVQQGILFGGAIVPANFTLNIRAELWIYNATVDLNSLLFKFFNQRVERLVFSHLFVGSLFTASIYCLTLSMVLRKFFFFHKFLWIGAWINLVILWIFFRAARWDKFGPIILDVEFNPTEFDDIATSQFIILYIEDQYVRVCLYVYLPDYFEQTWCSAQLRTSYCWRLRQESDFHHSL